MTWASRVVQLDVLANDVFINLLRKCGQCGVLVRNPKPFTNRTSIVCPLYMPVRLLPCCHNDDSIDPLYVPQM